MAEDNKSVSARDAALAVLAKAKEILQKSDLVGYEKLEKYETENKKAAGISYGKIETDQKPTDRDYNKYNVKPGSHKDSSDKREIKQVSPSKNPKEAAEGNNNSDGMEPHYEFKDKVKGTLKKETAALKGQPKDKNGYPGLGKAENPDKNADAKLGEKVEKDVEEHFKENKEAEKKEGHKLMAKSDGKTKHDRCVEHVEQNSPDVSNPDAVCSSVGVPRGKSEGETEHAIIPRLIGSAKLSKFMEHMHSKRKNREAQGAQAVSSDGPAAPAEGSTQAGQPDKTRPNTQPKTGDMDKHGLSPEQMKAKMGKSEMEKHGLSAGQMKAKLKK